jgi:hypothetical protein
MVNKIFALASVSALAGLVSTVAAAGCSDKDQANPSDATTGTKPGIEAGSPTDKEGGTASDDEACMAKQAIDETQFPYKKAVKQPGACTAKELDDLSKFFRAKAGAEDISMKEWAGTVSAGCAKCVFSDGTAASWTPILTTKDDKLDDVNRGGCIEIVSGKQRCGEAYQHVADCRMEACVNTCDTGRKFNECLQDVQGIFTGPCKGAYDALFKECGEDLGTYEQACKGNAWTFEGPVKVQCVTGGASTGGDAG